MGYFFLDIETYIDPEDELSGLNPYKSNSKVIAIAYNYYPDFILTENKIMPPTILKEWESDEKNILKEFYQFLQKKVEEDEHIKLVGFNHIKFDIPYLSARIDTHQIDGKQNIHNTLYVKPHHIDLGQLAMTSSQRMKFKKEFYNVSIIEVCNFFGIPPKKESAKKVSEYYQQAEYQKILDYIDSEFNFEKLYISLRRHFHSKRTMEKSNDS